jgi:opacity protein-like surface antigen/outer membrane protease
MHWTSRRGTAFDRHSLKVSRGLLARVVLLGSTAFAVLGATVFAADAADLQPAYFAPYSWTGFYGGVHVGAGFVTTTFSDPFGASIYGDKVRTPAFLGGGQVGYNWQAPGSPWVFGIEGDLTGLDSDGTNTCLAFSGFFLSANCHARPDLDATLTGRLGYALGPSNHTLLYAKGGVAWEREKVSMTTNALLPALSTSASLSHSGWTAGAGVEQALTPAWSIKLEYDFLDFSGVGVTTPTSFVQAIPPINGYFATAPGTSNVSQNIHEVKLGLNYRFGADPWSRWDAAPAAYPAKAVVRDAGWEVETGARYWYSTGRFQKDLGSGTSTSTADTLNSRLTYVSNANSGEAFARVETPWNLFAKGFIGAGSLANGKLNDEDWLIFGATVPYSNTLSDPVKGNIEYGTIDVGYDFARAASYKTGAFVGYNYYAENKSAYGCAQLANRFSDCVPSIPSSVLGITENDRWQSLRVGLNGEFMPVDRVKVSADAAYLPYVRFDGTDNHVLRGIVSPEWGTGRGVQMETIVSYYVTPQFSVGVGGRYWAMWTTSDAFTAFGGSPCPCQTLPAKTERYGTFLQGAYQFAPY